ncbi:hypothetical protein [Nostoc sp. UHCC 0252]|uniref:hypothetical protein n=1 Tax=Nostoc sp. UHCC 0252 TaxID=3110241 RepID=UPI002B20605B|nr:hypothetical protein [Nostoc sp. UHCC 0252]MEA5601076.1 hypothetical protein [Nostoc sp. UHCC 0252]
MALPANFSPVEHLHDLIRREHNKRVNAWFKNQRKDSLETPKENAYQACLIRDEDDANTMLLRKLFFEFDVGQAQALQAPIYGIPVPEHQRDIKYKPQVKLHFQERLTVSSPGDRTRGARQEITFRLMNESSDTISRADAERLATAIKRDLTKPLLIIEKGKYKATYLDDEHGYDFRLLVENEAEGIRVIKKILEIQGHSYNDDYFQFVKNNRTYSMTPGTHRVYGQTINKPVLRPTVPVRFRYAQLLIYGRSAHINLVAMSDVNLKSVIERVAST